MGSGTGAGERKEGEGEGCGKGGKRTEVTEKREKVQEKVVQIERGVGNGNEKVIGSKVEGKGKKRSK